MNNKIKKMINFKIKAFDKINSFFCESINAHLESESVERVRDFIKTKYLEKGYDGFSDDYDRYFDPFSIYFYVYDLSNNIHSAQRIIHKTQYNMLPMEKALIKDSKNKNNYLIGDSDAVEITSFVFKGEKSIKLLISSAAYYGEFIGTKKAFSLLDVKETSLKKLYQIIGWEESIKYNSNVYFPDYGKIMQGGLEPSIWKIMELSEDKIKKIARNINKYQIMLKKE